MKLSSSLLAALAVATTVSSATGQIRLNEIYASHCGVDDMEFVEIVGPPGASLDGYLVCVVEGDNTEQGRLDRVWNLSGRVIPADGFFVLGDVGVPNVDMIGATIDMLENGTDTTYLVQSTDPLAIRALAGMDVDPDGDRVTMIATHPSVVSIEAVAVVDENYPAQDVVFDCAAIFGTLECGFGRFRPAGLFRPSNAPDSWCNARFLDFNNTGACGGPCPVGALPTPGTANPASACSTLPSGTGCGPTGPLGSSYCTPGNLNSSGQPGRASAFGSVRADDNLISLSTTQLPAAQFGYFVGSETQSGGFIPPGSQGLLCMSGTIARFNQPGRVRPGPAFTVFIDLREMPTNPVAAVMGGETWNFQCWYRDLNPAATSNFTDAVSILFQ